MNVDYGGKMIIGLFLRNYKCYENLNFIGFSDDNGDLLNVFAGPNGVGKSSILESMHCLFNGVDPKTWSMTIGKKQDRTLVAPLFLVKKDLSISNSEYIEAISNAFWGYDFSTVHKGEYEKEFSEFRERLKYKVNIDDYWLLSAGKDSTGSIRLSPFHTQVMNKTKRDGVSLDRVKKIYSNLIDRYRYVYIPVENRVSDVLALQASEMQGLMDKAVVDEIKLLLDKKEHQPGFGKKKSILDLVNDSLEKYIGAINDKMDGEYRFQAKGGGKKTIRPNDVTEVIIKEFFSVRPLMKDGKHIKDLSSGQQRLALIDVATTLLSTRTEKAKEIILAIDEPENSLESSLRFKSFLRLINIAELFGRQLFVTTHWYGLLLKPVRGRLHYIDKVEVPVISSFPLNTIYDYRKTFPQSVEMKSYFDLVSSMLTLLKSEENNWLFCEGGEDAKYLELYLSKHLPNVNILPFNGCGNIKKLYQFLKIPLGDSDELAAVNGKVFCLIDTDTKNLVTVNGYKSDKCLRFERLAMDKSKFSARTISVANPDATQAEIEDVLEGVIMWNVLEALADDDPYLSDMLDNYSLESGAVYTGFSHGFPFLKRNNMHAHERIEELRTYLDLPEMKRKIAEEYCAQALRWDDLEPLPWMSEIIKHFTPKH